jgi:DNA polymerase I-like protein with 3'-5' exonuclease and polymerase domains
MLLWLLPKGKIDKRQNFINRKLSAINIPRSQVRFSQPAQRIEGSWVKKSQRNMVIPPAKRSELRSYILKAIKLTKPSVIALNCPACAMALLPDQIPNVQTLSKYRGSYFEYTTEFGTKVHVIVLDDAFKSYAPDFGDAKPELENYKFSSDIQKLGRYYHNNVRKQVPMTYTLCDTLELVEEAEIFLAGCVAIATDVETTGVACTCVGFTGLTKCGYIHSYTIPLMSGVTKDGQYWPDVQTMIIAWKAIKRILEDPSSMKIMQNGRYDIDYFFKYNVYVKNYLLDTMIMMHSFSGVLPKSLAFIASITCDNYYYWKEEIKGSAKSKTTKSMSRIPKTEKGMNIYFEYCARDCYYTLYAAMTLLPIMMKNKWWRDNYFQSYQIQYGPAYEMSTYGMQVDPKRKRLIVSALKMSAAIEKTKLQRILNNKSFNPKAPKQVASLFYDFLGVKPIGRNGKTTREAILRRATARDGFTYLFFRIISDFKKPAKLAQDLVKLKLFKERLLCSYNAVGTWTSRFSSKSHNWWVGTNLQNQSKKVRPIVVADKGMVIAAADYSQSDGYFVAYESQDLNYISVMKRNMLEGYDTHSHHVEMILRVPYDEVVAGKKAKDPFIVDPVTGRRNIMKKVIHGTNYIMGPDTMLSSVGVVPIIIAAKDLGWTNAEDYDDKTLKKVVGQMQRSYYRGYPRLVEWQSEVSKEAIGQGNLITCYGGRTHNVIGDLSRDRSGRLARGIAAFYGQGGTAGNINRTLLMTYYPESYLQSAIDANNTELVKALRGIIAHHRDIKFCGQVHDEIIWQIPETKLFILDYLLVIMQQPITIHGREFFVPAEMEIGKSWNNYIVYEGLSSDKPNIWYLQKLASLELAYLSKLQKGKM